MKIFEVDNGKFVNMDNVFRFELIDKTDDSKHFWRFYSSDENLVSSRDFDDTRDAINWLNITLARAEAAEEIIFL